jgi:hypothetical protein
MNITGTDVAVFVVCMLFVLGVFLAKSKKHSRDHIIDRRRTRPPSTPPKE